MGKLNLLLVILLVSFSCTKTTQQSKILPRITGKQKIDTIKELPKGKKIVSGKASYYGEKWNGRTTANMEIFNCEERTTASPTLPFGTILKVTNTDNNKSVYVRVNDRGPYEMYKDGSVVRPLKPHSSRILDLSKSSFEAISKLEKGVIPITYEIVEKRFKCRNWK